MSCPADPSLASLCRRDGDRFAVALELGDDNAEAVATAKQSLAGYDGATLTTRAQQWWQEFWDGTAQIELPDEFYNQFYQYTLYKFAAGTNPMGGIPAGLQGPWIEEYQKAQWSGDYHFNINIQMIYQVAFAAGCYEHLLPLFDMVEQDYFWQTMHHNARVLFGIDDGLLLTHAVDDRGMQCGWIMAGSTLDQACSGWLGKLYWDYYLHTGDRDFLEDRAYPFIYGIVRVYEEMLEERDGALSMPLAISAEYGCRNPKGIPAGADPSYQIACLHSLVDILLEASEILGETPRPIWSEIQEKLPAFKTIEGKDPYGVTEKRIAIWEDQDLDECHRHHSHLGCLYPFDSLPEEMPAEMAETLDNSLDHWILKGMGQWSEWCMPWAAMIQTRAGFNEAPYVLLNFWREIFVNEGLHTAYLPRFRGLVAHRRHDMNKPKEDHEVIQLDGAMGAATAITETLVHTRGKTVKLFAGIPAKWQTASFENVRAPGGFRISASRAEGATAAVTIRAERDGILSLFIPDRNIMTLCRGTKTEEIAFPARIAMSAGEEVVLN
jgi:hypothetical protein